MLEIADGCFTHPDWEWLVCRVMFSYSWPRTKAAASGSQPVITQNCTMLHHTTLHCTMLHYFTPHYTALHYAGLCNTIPHHTAPLNCKPHYEDACPFKCCATVAVYPSCLAAHVYHLHTKSRIFCSYPGSRKALVVLFDRDHARSVIPCLSWGLFTMACMVARCFKTSTRSTQGNLQLQPLCHRLSVCLQGANVMLEQSAASSSEILC